jgi:hypothetical protein
VAQGQSAATGDQQSPQAPRGQEYGEAGAQLAGQAIVPIAGSPTPSNPHTAAITQAGPAAPGTIPTLSDPTAYPGEPIQTGLMGGPGAGPEALAFSARNQELAKLKAIYNIAPTESLRRLIEWSETNL